MSFKFKLYQSAWISFNICDGISFVYVQRTWYYSLLLPSVLQTPPTTCTLQLDRQVTWVKSNEDVISIDSVHRSYWNTEWNRVVDMHCLRLLSVKGDEKSLTRFKNWSVILYWTSEWPFLTFRKARQFPTSSFGAEKL